ncbi:unnamed protein product [Urochloa humidicola]
MDAGAQEDRLSDLPDGVLGHVLSFLGAKEAARAAVLSRRYRHAFASVHTLSFVQEDETPSRLSSDRGASIFALRKEEERRNAEFVALVNAAFSCRRRYAGGGDPGLRAVRVVFDAFRPSLAGDVDSWLSAAGAALEEIHIDACPVEERGVCARQRSDWYFSVSIPSYNHRYRELKDESDGEDDPDVFRDPEGRDRAYRVSRWLFSSRAGAVAGLRTLCLGSCFLDLPRDATTLHFPSVETLVLKRIPDSGRDIQRLVSACGRLADLTLDSCRRVRGLAVLDKRLRRLALRCCHGARLAVDASCLRALEYKGPVPDGSVLSFAVASPPALLSSCDIKFCGKMTASTTDAELADLARFLGRFTEARRLHLGSSRCISAGVDRINLSCLTPLPCLRRLELKGTLSSSSGGGGAAMAAVARILELTPNLEVLTLLILPDAYEFPRYRAEVTCDPDAALDIPELPVTPCLRDRVRELNVVC